MKKHKRGFTLIEVILFLAVTTALFVGIAAGVQGSIFQQRYTDSVQNYAEFLRSVYSQVSNVQNESTGRSDKAIYGKVVTFREKEGWNGEGTRNEIKTYNLIGDVERTQANGQVGSGSQGTGDDTVVSCPDNGSVIGRLQCLQANVFMDKGSNTYVPVGFVENYTVRWNAEIQKKDAWNDDNGYKLYKAIMIVAHSPSSGNISTYIWDDEGEEDTIEEVIKKIDDCASGAGCGDGDPFKTKHGTFDSSNAEGTYLSSSNFKSNDIDFCVNPNGYEYSTVRRNIRMSAGAHNASAVDVLTEDTTTGADQGLTNEYDHNRCG